LVADASIGGTTIPMTLGNMRAQGVRSLSVSCLVAITARFPRVGVTVLELNKPSTPGHSWANLIH
jgi:hypothetical protein